MPTATAVEFLNALCGILQEAQIKQNDLGEKGSTGAPLPVSAVYPENREQVQEIIRLAGLMKVPLVPVSSGPPHRTGIAAVPGAVTVSLERMKRIIRIDPESRSVWLEPGVTFGALLPELKNHGLRLNHPLLPRANKSVVASLLEREPVLIPKYQYDYVDPLLTLEVVYGTGNDFRTGSASGPGPLDKLRADKVNPWGPGAIDYMRFLTGAQGTMGFVTWAVTKAEIIPALQKLYFVTSDNVQPLVALTNDMLRKRVGDECLILNRVNLAALLGSTAAESAALMASLPPWTLIVCAAGYERYPEERLSIQVKYLMQLCGNYGLKADSKLPETGNCGERLLELLAGCEEGTETWKNRVCGGCREIFFLSPMSRTAALTDVMAREAAKHGFPQERLGVTIQPLVQGRGCHVGIDLYYDPAKAAEVSATELLFIEASASLMASGAYFSRSYGPWAGMVYGKAPETVAALKKLKGIFDPENILNPGKLCF